MRRHRANLREPLAAAALAAAAQPAAAARAGKALPAAVAVAATARRAPRPARAAAAQLQVPAVHHRTQRCASPRGPPRASVCPRRLAFFAVPPRPIAA